MANILSDKPDNNARPSLEALPDKYDNAGGMVEVGAAIQLEDLLLPESPEVEALREQADHMDIDYSASHNELDQGFRQKTYSRAKDINAKLQQEEDASHADADTNYVIDERGHGGGPYPEGVESGSIEPMSAALVDAAYFEGAVGDAIGSAFVYYGSEHRFDVPVEQGAPGSLAYGFDGALDFSFNYEPEE